MPKITVIGTTSWGITLAVVLARKGVDTRLWARTKPEAATVKNKGYRSGDTPGVLFPN